MPDDRCAGDFKHPCYASDAHSFFGKSYDLLIRIGFATLIGVIINKSFMAAFAAVLLLLVW